MFTGGSTSLLGGMPYRTIELKIAASNKDHTSLGGLLNLIVSGTTSTLLLRQEHSTYGDGTVYLPLVYCIYSIL